MYFWRWATLKVFGSGWKEATGETQDDRFGIICFITVAGFLNGPGFQKMREDLRRDCSDIWIIDCTPDGHQPDVPTRIFQGVQQPVCIVLAARPANKSREEPARLRYMALPKGKREEKFAALAGLSLHQTAWKQGHDGWREPFLPEEIGAWANYPSLADFFSWSSPGVKTHRTWVISPDVPTLERRWKVLQRESDPTKKEFLFHADRDRNTTRLVNVDLGPHPVRPLPLVKDKGPVASPVRYAFRSFDKQWIIPDHRLLSMARPQLWTLLSDRQLFITAPEDVSPTAGPALTCAALLPDMHHYHGRGGRVYPLWRDRAATQPNIKPELLTFLAQSYGRPVKAEDVMAYIAAVMAHPAFTKRFAPDLVQPGLRVPLTADANLFAEAVALGTEVIWLHCYGERFADPAAGRPKQAPRLPKDRAPFIPADGAIPSAPAPLPDTMDYDPAKRRLLVGAGFVENVSPEMWAYEVSGKQVIWHWFSYRRRDRSRPIIGDRRPPSPLDSIQPDSWLPEYTTDLLDLLHVLGRLIDLEPAQADLLERICASPLRTADELRAAGVIGDAQEQAAATSGNGGGKA